MLDQNTHAQFDEERHGFSQVISDLKAQLMSLQVKLQGNTSAVDKDMVNSVCLDNYQQQVSLYNIII